MARVWRCCGGDAAVVSRCSQVLGGSGVGCISLHSFRGVMDSVLAPIVEAAVRMLIGVWLLAIGWLYALFARVGVRSRAFWPGYRA